MKTRKSKGFTLIELLVVIAIIGLLSTLAIVALNSARQKSRDAKRVSDIKQVQTALELYYADKSNYPADPGGAKELGVDAKKLCDSGWSGAACAATTYMGEVPKDPQSPTTKYVYAVGPNNASYTISFNLEGKVGSIGPGASSADPNGVHTP